MIVWSHAPGATAVKFSISAINPLVGNCNFVTNRFEYQSADSDEGAYFITTKNKLTAPVPDVFYEYVDESLFQDGQFLISYEPVGGTGSTGVYSVRVIDGVESQPNLPLSSTAPKLCLISGREIGIDGAPRRDVSILVFFDNGDTAYSTAGFVAGAVKTKTDIDGQWELGLIPTEFLYPQARYVFEIRHPDFGLKRFDNIYIPNVSRTDLNYALVYSKIKSSEITPPFMEQLGPVADGYCRVTGRIVNVAGVPISGLKVRIGQSQNMDRIMTTPANTYGGTTEIMTGMESVVTIATEPNIISTISKYPGDDATGIALPIGSDVLGVIAGSGNELRVPVDFSYDKASGLISFIRPFVGIVKYRQNSGGRFQVDLPSGNEYWVQLGDIPLRYPLRIRTGVSSLILSEFRYPSEINCA